jgi:hypothetical protein
MKRNWTAGSECQAAPAASHDRASNVEVQHGHRNRQVVQRGK